MMTDSLNSRHSTKFSSKGTTSGKKISRLKVDEVFDVIDHGEFGIEIQFLDYSRKTYHGEEAQLIVQDLKAQIRAREDWTKRSEHWEGFETLTGVFEGRPSLEGRIYSFTKENRILLSRMTKEEKEAMRG